MATRMEAVAPIALRRADGGLAEVGLLAYPVVLQTLSDTAMQVVDSAIVGRLGVTELGAVGFGGIWLWTMLVVFFGAATGAQTFVAQAFGANRRRECGGWFWQGLYVLFPAAIVWTLLLAVLFEPLLGLFGTSPELRRLATAYARARLCGAPALVPAVLLTSFFRGLGDTRTPLLGALGVNGLNALLAYGLVFGRFGLPSWGVVGAGTATAIALWTYAAVLLIPFMHPRRADLYGTRPRRPDLAAMRRFARTSLPVGGQWVLDMLSFALFSSIIARMGDAAMAATQALIQLLSLSFMQAFGISIAAGVLVGRYVGAGDLEAAARSHHSALKLGGALAASVAALFLTMPDTLLAVFTRDADVLILGRPLLVIGALFQLIDAMGIIAGGALRGAGDTRWPFLVQTLFAWMLRLPLVYLFAFGLGRGVIGAWLGELGYVAVLGGTFLWRFRSGAWREIRI